MTRRRYVFLGRVGKLYRFATRNPTPRFLGGGYDGWLLCEVPVERFWGRA